MALNSAGADESGAVAIQSWNARIWRGNSRRSRKPAGLFRIHRLEREQAWLLVLADGMGGEAAGEIASRLAVDEFVVSFEAHRQAGKSLDHALGGALQSANNRIGQEQEERPETLGMGTTMVGAYLSPAGIAWISVGDSPLWLYRADDLRRLNEDHSLRQMGGSAGNMLQSALNGQPIPLVNCRAIPLPVHDGDLIVLCSDGILTLAEDQIAETIRNSATTNPEFIVWLLLHAVEDKKKRHQDNCTALIASMSAGATSARSRPFAKPLSAKVIVIGACIMLLLTLALTWIL